MNDANVPGQPPAPVFDGWDDDDDDFTTVDQGFWLRAPVPNYPVLASFGSLEILGRLGRGGMAEVYLARDANEEDSDRHVAVKRMLPEFQEISDVAKMFFREGEMAKRLFHPHICEVYECGTLEGTAFMTMEWVWGVELRDVIQRMSNEAFELPWIVAVEITARIANALQYVHHAKGVHGKEIDLVHRDVSPQNIMLSWQGDTKLLDFGIAKASQEDHSGGRSPRGKFAYMSPEQVQSQPIDQRSDIFALGVCLYELLAGSFLFERQNVMATMQAVVHEHPTPMSHLRSDIPPGLEDVIHRAIAKPPAERFASAAEFERALRKILERENEQVTDQRIALLLDGMFSAEEKAALSEEAQQVTGAFSALEISLNSEDSMTISVFDHSGSQEAVLPLEEAAGETPMGNRMEDPEASPRWRRIVVTALLVSAVVLGGGTYLVLRGTLGLP